MRDYMITLLICSVTMSALSLFYMAVTPLLAKRYSVTSRYYTWLIMVIGLIFPFRPRFHSALVKVVMTGDTAAPVIQIGNRAPVAVFGAANAVLPPAIPHILWWQAAAAVWLAGMSVFLVYHAAKHRRFLKMAARWSDAITDEQTYALFQNLKAEMGITENIGLRFCDCVGSPMMTGLANPCILLPRAEFAPDELHFILKHELVHYRQKDLWYKCLVLLATAMHWFNPIVYLMAKAIDLQCELSCDEKVIRSTGADIRQYYSETIIGVVRYQSKLKTVLSTHFYGGKKGMKERIFSIMDMSRKRAGSAVICGILILTLFTGFVLPAKAENQSAPEAEKQNVAVAPGIGISFIPPNPDVYSIYAAYGITISEDGSQLLYKGRPVRQFIDDNEKVDGKAFYLDESGSLNLSAVRNEAGEITGIESITAQKAQEYYDEFFQEELTGPMPEVQVYETVSQMDNETVSQTVNEATGSAKYDQYQPFGITVSAKDGVVYFNGKRVKLLVDRYDGWYATYWTDDAGTVNLSVVRDASNQIAGIEPITEEKARQYRSEADEYENTAPDDIDEEAIGARAERKVISKLQAEE